MADMPNVIRVSTHISQLEDPELYALLLPSKGRSAVARMLLRKSLLGAPVANAGSVPAQATPTKAAALQMEVPPQPQMDPLREAFHFPAAGAAFQAKPKS